MKTAGIIAEYNPLHKGHQYHIRKSLEFGRADAIIALISSNFTQRGEPSVADKRARAEMALACGADLVLELPCAFSCRNAGIFADAAVDTLAATGVADAISFGAESPEKLALLERMADALNDEGRDFRRLLKRFLDMGCSFVQSRSMALDERIPGSGELLRHPNNSLALAYIKRIREKGYPIETIAVERIGARFHDARA
ncbi:MAG: nucleotidyltransferase family protein, partial [Synergistaceae bacterium]|nr:nucleotidyltransferase family protein [Synergistaceae bacterium]